jgi:hypothetical protein
MTDTTTYLALAADNSDGSVRVIKRYDDVSLEDYERFLQNIEKDYEELPRLKKSDEAMKMMTNILKVIVSDFNLVTPTGIDTIGLGHALMAIGLQYAENPVDSNNNRIDLSAKICGFLIEEGQNRTAIQKAYDHLKYEAVSKSVDAILDIAKGKVQTLLSKSDRNYQHDQTIFEANMAKYLALFQQSQAQIGEWVLLMQKELLTAPNPQQIENIPPTLELPAP